MEWPAQHVRSLFNVGRYGLIMRACSLFVRQVRAYAIPGGSEEILLDLAARQAVKQMTAKL